MSTTLPAIDTRSRIETAKQYAESTKSRFLNTFSAVPDDKLNFTPAPTSKSALRIAAHVGISNFAFEKILRKEPFPGSTMEEIFAYIDAEERKITTREQAVGLIEQSHQAVLAALDDLTAEDVTSNIETPVMNGPMTFFMDLAGYHYIGHAAQIDYLQTIWGDMDMHF